MNDAKAMTEYYQGYKRYDDDGNLVASGTGLISKLASEAQAMREQANLGQRFLNRTFGTFNKDKDINAFNVCVRYANSENLFRRERNSLIILGSVGSGKTHLAASIANLLVDRGVPVMFETFSDALESLRQEFNSSGERKHLAMLKSAPLLVLDDIGREKRSDWTQQVLFDIINYRYEHMTPVVITTNLDKRDFARYLGDDIFSRLCEMSEMVETVGGDHRRGQ